MQITSQFPISKMLLHVIRGFKDAGPTWMEFLSNHFSMHASDNSTKLTKVVGFYCFLMLRKTNLGDIHDLD